MFFDPVYLLFALPGLLIAGLASMYTHSTFSQYKEIPANSGLTGAQSAQLLLSRAGIRDVQIEETSGFLSDHYDPTARVLRLSPDVFEGRSLSSIGVACHEAGHALQHAAGYQMMFVRSALVPITQFSSFFSYLVILGGFLLQSQGLILLGAILFSAAVLFSIVTLPVEWDASARAKRLMLSYGIVTEKERDGAAAVLNAAFLTYVAAVLSSVLTLLYYLYRAGIFNRRD